MGRSIVNRRLITATLARARDPETLSVHQMLGRERKSRDLVRIFCMVMEGPDVHLGSARHLRTVIRGRPPPLGSRRSSLRCASERCSGGSHSTICVPIANRLLRKSLTTVSSDRRFQGPSPDPCTQLVPRTDSCCEFGTRSSRLSRPCKLPGARSRICLRRESRGGANG